MKKLFSVVACAAVIGWAGSAMAVPYYESYEGYQSVNEGKSYDFFFDLLYNNDVFGPDPLTNSSLKLKSDAAAGRGAIFESVYVNVSLFSADLAGEKASIKLTSFYNNTETVLFDGWFDNSKDFRYDITHTPFINDPWGEITIKASITPWWNYNDFAITKVAIGGETAPVPEPTTMLLFGTGLLGLAAVGRRRKATKA